MARTAFGTDGVRGVAGEVLTAELALALGRAVTTQSPARAPAGARHPRHARVGRDARGGARGGRRVRRRRRAARRRAADARPRRCCSAATASTSRRSSRASHNPYRDNGIKFFGPDGFKLSDDDRGGDRGAPRTRRAAAAGAASAACASCTARSRTTCASCRRASPSSTSTGVDVAAGLRQRRHLPRRAGDLPAPGRDGDRRSPTSPTGATSTPAAAPRTSTRSRARSRAGGHDVGFAFDGDGDRVLAVDRTGAVVDGDELIALAALHLRERGRLPGDGVAVTVMTNYGFHAAMRERGRRGRDAPRVGDRYVLEELRARGWALGGEQSGHIIDMGFVPSGDGIASALLTLEALARRRPRRARGDGEAAPAAGQRAASPTATPRWRAPSSPRPSTRESAARWRAAAACSCARRAPSSSCA